MSQPADSSAVDLLERYQNLVWKISHSFAENDADLDDLRQEICISLWTAYDKIPTEAKEFTFVYRVALNRALSWQRKRRTYLKHLRRFFTTVEPSERRPVDSASASDLERLYRAVRSLPELDRSLMLLYLDQQSYAEMADILGISEAAVGKRISRAKEALAKNIQRGERTS